MIAKYMSEIEELRTKLCESENLCEQLRKENTKVKRLSATFNQTKLPWLGDTLQGQDESGFSVQELIDMAKQELEKEKEADEGKEADDEYDGDDNDDDDSDTDTESEVKAITNELNEELVELTSEISLKQKLIEELEMSQKRMASMKQQYENKLLELNNRIHHTQEERDKVLKNMGGKTVVPDQINKIKKDYQEKLDKLQGEVKKLQAAKKEHAKLLKESRKNESKIKSLETEKRLKETVLKRK